MVKITEAHRAHLRNAGVPASFKPLLITAWIIERKGHAPTLTHYASVADEQRKQGAAVTPYCSQF